MRNKIVILMLGVLLSCGELAQADDITFTSSGTINSADVWEHVRVENDGTTVNMGGGQVGYLSMGGASIFNMSDGQISHWIDIEHSSTINVTGGTINNSLFVVYSGGTANLNGGTITTDTLKTYDTSTININDGILDFEYFGVNGIVNIRGGILNAKGTGAGFDATINIYGYGFHYQPESVPYYNDGILTGYLLDGNAFSFGGLSDFGYARFNLLPEPATLCLLALGGLFLRRNSKK